MNKIPVTVNAENAVSGIFIQACTCTGVDTPTHPGRPEAVKKLGAPLVCLEAGINGMISSAYFSSSIGFK